MYVTESRKMSWKEIYQNVATVFCVGTKTFFPVELKSY